MQQYYQTLQYLYSRLSSIVQTFAAQQFGGPVNRKKSRRAVRQRELIPAAIPCQSSLR